MNNLRIEINKSINQENDEKNQKTKSGFYEKNHQDRQTLSKLIKRKRELLKLAKTEIK